MCDDGYCRANCSLLTYSNCPLTKPIKCGDGRCVSYEFQCASYSCPMSKPYLCPNMVCAPFLKNCTDTIAYRPFKTISVAYNLGAYMSKIGIDIDGVEVVQRTGELQKTTNLFTVNSNFEIFAPPEDSPHLKELKGKHFNGNCSLDIAPVARNELSKVNNTLESNRSITFDESYPFENMAVMNYFSVRSAVLKISTKGRKDNNEYFSKPLTVRFAYDEIKVSPTNATLLKSNLCLGTVVGEDGKTQDWICISRKILNVVKGSTGALIEYEVPGPGIFAVIFRPDFVDL